MTAALLKAAGVQVSDRTLTSGSVTGAAAYGRCPRRECTMRPKAAGSTVDNTPATIPPQSCRRTPRCRWTGPSTLRSSSTSCTAHEQSQPAWRSPTSPALPPTLVLAADDGAMPLEHLAAVRRTLPNCQIAVVPGTSHGVAMEKLHIVNQLIIDFLADEQAPKLFSTTDPESTVWFKAAARILDAGSSAARCITSKIRCRAAAHDWHQPRQCRGIFPARAVRPKRDGRPRSGPAVPTRQAG